MPIFVPVFLLLPFAPVFLELAIGNPLMPWWHTPEIRRDVYQNGRHSSSNNMNPRPIIAVGTIPTALMGAVPVTMVKENIHFNVGDKVNIGIGYHEYRRGSRNYKRGRRRAPYAHIDIHLGKTFIGIVQAEQKHHSNPNNH
jgi:hypothetical protein